MQYSRALFYTFPLIRGEDVRAVQIALLAIRVDPSCGAADGVFGQATKAAVLGFQQLHKELKEDGVVGSLTWKALFEAASASDAPAPHIQLAAAAISTEPPPLSPAQVVRVKDWLMKNFGPVITAAAARSTIDVDLICAIACKESAIYWLQWIDTMSPTEVLTHCVFDASGDAPGTSRSAFPQNTAAFRERYGDALTKELIDEANAMRALRHLGPEQWIYKGYGVFQYDLQNILTDEGFFRQKQWGDIEICVDRLMQEMSSKLQIAGNDLRDAVRRYNGSGLRAQEYASHVLLMRDWSSQHQVA